MPTTYPVTLPLVTGDPQALWGGERIADPTYDCPDDGPSSAASVYEIDGANRSEAELRLLAWIDHSFEDDLRGAVATADVEVHAGRWKVTLRIFCEF